MPDPPGDFSALLQEEGGDPWIARPAHERQRVDPRTGQVTTRWYPIITFPDAWQKKITALIMTAWEEYQATGILPGSPVIGGSGEAQSATGGRRS